MISQVLSLLYLLIVLGIISILLTEDRNPISSIPWLLLIVFVPVGGLILFLIFGQSIRRKITSRSKVDSAVRLGAIDIGKETPVDGESMLPPLARLIERTTGAALTTLQQVDCFRRPSDWCDVLRSDIADAKEYIYIQVYRLDDDESLSEILPLLEQRSQHGVSVRLLYDDVGSRGTKKALQKRLRDAGIEVEVLLPVRFRLFTSRVNYRNHRNIVVIDGRIGYLGNMSMRQVSDLTSSSMQLRISGDAVLHLHHYFCSDWAEATGTLIPSPPITPVQSISSSLVSVQIFATNPTDARPSLEMIWTQALLRAKRTVWIESPVLIPPNGLLQTLITTALSGVDVRILLPRKGDSRLAPVVSRAFFHKLLEAGVKIYYDYGGNRHSGYCLVDDEYLIMGTPQLDFRSFENNYEISACLYSSSLTKEMSEQYETTLTHCKEIKYRKITLMRQLTYAVGRLFTPLL